MPLKKEEKRLKKKLKLFLLFLNSEVNDPRCVIVFLKSE